MLLSIREQLDQFDLSEHLLTHQDERTLSGRGHGTQFIIQPTDDALVNSTSTAQAPAIPLRRY